MLFEDPILASDFDECFQTIVQTLVKREIFLTLFGEVFNHFVAERREPLFV